MVTGKESKRVETSITLEDTDDDDPPPPPPARRSVVNKRRRTVLEVDDDDDDDDDDNVIVLPQTRAGNSNRLVKLIYFSHNDSVYRYPRCSALDSNWWNIIVLVKTISTFRLRSNINIDFFTTFIFTFYYATSRTATTTATKSTRSIRTSAPHDDDVSVSEPPTTRRRSTRTSQASQEEGSQAGKPSVMNRDDNPTVESRLSKIPRKSVTDDNGNALAGKGNSIIQNAELLTLPPTKLSPVRNNRDSQQQHRPTQDSAALDKNLNKMLLEQESQRNPNSFQASHSTEIGKEEKLRKYIESQQSKSNEQQQQQQQQQRAYTTTITKQTTKNRYAALAMQDLQQICHQFRSRASDEGITTGKVRLDVQLSSRGRVDLFGSFICTPDNDARQLDDRCYDFFDVNDQGEIVLLPPQPMFPDEFLHHQSTRSAAWWGIVEPSLGTGKYKSHPPSTYTPRSSSTNESTGTAMIATVKNGDDKMKYKNSNVMDSRGRDTVTMNEIRIGNRSERIGMNMGDERQHHTDRRHEKSSNHWRNQEASFSRNHDRR